MVDACRQQLDGHRSIHLRYDFDSAPALSARSELGFVVLLQPHLQPRDVWDARSGLARALHDMVAGGSGCKT